MSAATSAPERTRLAALAPVRSVAATRKRKRARMWAPMVPRSVEAAQNSASPTIPPRSSNTSERQKAPWAPSGPSPSVPAPSASSRATKSTTPPARKGRNAGMTGLSTRTPPTSARTSGAVHFRTPKPHANASVSPAPIAPASHPSQSGKTRKTARATRPEAEQVEVVLLDHGQPRDPRGGGATGARGRLAAPARGSADRPLPRGCAARARAGGGGRALLRGGGPGRGHARPWFDARPADPASGSLHPRDLAWPG